MIEKSINNVIEKLKGESKIVIVMATKCFTLIKVKEARKVFLTFNKIQAVRRNRKNKLQRRSL